MTDLFANLGSNGTKKILRPGRIFRSLPDKPVNLGFPRDIQSEVWDRWFERRNEPDLVLKMNTGSGKTVVGLLILVMIASSTLFVVDQRQFAVVYSLGEIKEVITEPGLNFKLPPPFQNVSYIDKRLLTLDSVDTEPMLTADETVLEPNSGWIRDPGTTD